jgi:hypothetical protein
MDIPQQDGSVIRVRWCVKSYEVGSQYGINEGCISKLQLEIGDKTVASYDRGWDMEPTCEAANTALSVLLKAYN